MLTFQLRKCSFFAHSPDQQAIRSTDACFPAQKVFIFGLFTSAQRGDRYQLSAVLLTSWRRRSEFFCRWLAHSSKNFPYEAGVIISSSLAGTVPTFLKACSIPWKISINEPAVAVNVRLPF
jgi:hypothetical protein